MKGLSSSCNKLTHNFEVGNGQTSQLAPAKSAPQLSPLAALPLSFLPYIIFSTEASVISFLL